MRCYSLESVLIPDEIISLEIKRDVFSECRSLMSIYFPKGVNISGGSIFSNCPTTIYCESEEKPIGWQEAWSGGCSVVWGSKRESAVIAS